MLGYHKILRHIEAALAQKGIRYEDCARRTNGRIDADLLNDFGYVAKGSKGEARLEITLSLTAEADTALPRESPFETIMVGDYSGLVPSLKIVTGDLRLEVEPDGSCLAHEAGKRVFMGDYRAGLELILGKIK